MQNRSTGNKKIAKNTFILYIRSVVVMLITLYTSRVVLKELGIEDYGLYNVIGGVVALFAFLRTSLTKSTQRFLNTEMVKPDGRLNETFCTSLNIHLVIGVVALILAETIGLWFLNTYIQIPLGREFAANVVYQSTVISLVVTIVSVPYNAEIIAHEDMSYFAFTSIIDAILKLGIALFLALGTWDKLIIYGYLMAGINIFNFFLYYIFCKRKYYESSYSLIFDKSLIREMLGYTTWTIVGQFAIIGTNQGNNILMNMFHSVTANAAMGVAHQVNGAIVSLTSNFQTAFNPQITKSYAARDFENLRKLVYTTSKISFSLLLVASLPIVYNIDFVLDIWLAKVPQYAGAFCILVIVNSILNALSAPLNFSVLSSGKIKWFQIVTSVVYLSDLLILYVLFSIGFPAVTALCVKVAIMVVILFVRIYFAHREVECINLDSYLKIVLIPLIFACIIPVVLGYFLFTDIQSILVRLVYTSAITVITFICLYYIALSTNERDSLVKIIKKRKKREKNNA